LERPERFHGDPSLLLGRPQHHHQRCGAAAGSATDEPTFNVLELILVLLDDYIVATPAQRMVIALWMLGTHVYDQFECFRG
jgi:hypothetical protein